MLAPNRAMKRTFYFLKKKQAPGRAPVVAKCQLHGATAIIDLKEASASYDLAHSPWGVAELIRKRRGTQNPQLFWDTVYL